MRETRGGLLLAVVTSMTLTPSILANAAPTVGAGTQPSGTAPVGTLPSSMPATNGTTEAPTFESLVRGAVPMSDLGTLLAPFAGKCDAETRELDRVRCRTTRRYLRRVIPQHSFWTVVDDPAAIAVSEFDAGIKGYHLSIAGCLACSQPVTVGRTREKRLITLKAPEKEAESLRAAVELSRNSVAFDTLVEAKTWFGQVRPELRTQFVFQPADTEWSFGPSRGYALKLLGVRVFNRCTGEILVSRPPSTGIADMPGIDDGCRLPETGKDPSDSKSASSEMPSELSKSAISLAMSIIRPQVFACFSKYRVPGIAQFEYVVAGNGTVRSVRLSGAFHGTPTGSCLIEAAQNARFPSFAGERQQFAYPFFLRQ
jgi:hypothetical protein